MPGAPVFSSASLSPILDAACEAAGLSSRDAELLRLGENAIYRLPDSGVVVRIGRSSAQTETVGRELCVSRWLREEGVPAIKVHEVKEQPLNVRGHPVTFWEAVSGEGPEPTHVDLAGLLRAFHRLGNCSCDLPAFDPFVRVWPRIEIGHVDEDARDFLHGRCTELARELEGLEFALPPGPIHGDAHTGNLLLDGGSVVLSDFEAVAIGPREWDLLPTAIAQARAGLPEKSYQAFAAAYGFDVRSWSGYPVLREIRELGMTTWLMQNVAEDPAIAAEFNVRLTSLRESDSGRRWTYF